MIDRWLATRDRLLTSPGFQRWASSVPGLRWITRRRARAVFDVVAGFVYSQVLHACVKLDIFEQVAAQILQQHASALPDLRKRVVILPNYHVAVPLAQHLARAAGLPALLLPKMVTINDWAEAVPLALISTGAG